MTAPVWWWWRWWVWSRLPPQAKKLEVALGRLSLCEETKPGAIPYYDRIPDIARQLTIMQRKDPPIARQAEQLKPVVSHLQALAQGERWDGLDPDHAPASDNLPLEPRLKLIKLAGEAGELALEIEAFLSELPKRPRGRPTSTTSADNIALFLYQEFERLTGHAPNRVVDLNGDETGEFTVLVREVFAILGVKSKPDEAARRAVEAHGIKSGK